MVICAHRGFEPAGSYRAFLSGAFIGSDSQLVAPVTVGRDAYVGAGLVNQAASFVAARL